MSRNCDAMHCTDSEMMEAEAELKTGPNTAFRNSLSMARQLIDQGKPSQALQAVVMSIKIQEGDEAASLVLNRAKVLFLNKIQSSADAAELSSHFAKFAIAEAIPLSLLPEHNINAQSTEPDAWAASILSKSGRMQIMVDASSDGSSFICLQCGGLVSNQRKEEHSAFWCVKI